MSDFHYEKINVRALRQLLDALAYDTSRRYEILREELTHLINAVRYRIDPRFIPGTKKVPESYQPSNGYQRFLARIAEAAETLHKECIGDVKEWTQTRCENLSQWQLYCDAKQPEKLTDRARFEVLFNAKCLNKAIVIAERMGDLHDRLEQFLQRTNPDHPEPTLRRRLEQGLTDKYLSELTRWVHRDLAEFASHRYLGAPYVHEQIPSTFQFWVYANQCRHHSFMTYEEHRKWSNAIEDIDSPVSKRKVKQDQVDDRFVSIAVSYWIPERPALIPMLGHELGHQVLRTVYGRGLDKPLLETDMSALGSVQRRVQDCAEKWLARKMEEGVTAEQTNSLVHEILCDCFAAVRFGWAYAYAWVLETLADKQYADLLENRYGYLRRADFEASSDRESVVKKLRDDTQKLGKSLRKDVLAHYYRGQVIYQVLTSLNTEADHYQEQLQLALKALLHVMLSMHTYGDTGRAQREIRFAEELAGSVCFELLNVPSKFIYVARKFCRPVAGSIGSPNFNESFDHQRLSRSYVSAFMREVKKTLPQGAVPADSDIPGQTELDALGKARALTDLVWRAEWMLSGVKAESLPNASSQQPTWQNEMRNQVRELLPLGMDDYLYRTADPLRLFATLATNDGERRDLLGESKTNHLYKVAEAYDAHPTKSYMAKVAKSGNSPVPVLNVRNKKFTFSQDAVDWLKLISVSGFYLKLFDTRKTVTDRMTGVRNSVIYLDLLKVRPLKDVPNMPLTVHPPARSTDAASSNFAIDAKPAVSKWDTVPADWSKYSVLSSGTLLGRYDAFVFYHQRDNNGYLGWRFEAPQYKPQEDEISYAARAKRLVRVWSADANLNVEVTNKADQSAIVALVLISLNWESSRVVIANWLATSTRLSGIKSELNFAVFLSDGWEDIVLALSPKTTVKDAVVGCTKLVTLLNTTPFVASTETLFTQQLMTEPPEELHFRFTCRVGEPSTPSSSQANIPLGAPYEQTRTCLQDAVNFFLSEVANSEFPVGSIKVLDVAGNKDFEILLPTKLNANANTLRFLIHEALPTCRIETRLSWSR